MWKVGGIKIEFGVWYTFFLQADTEKCKKTRIFVKHSVTENFWEQRSSESLRTHLSEYLDERGGTKIFFRVLVAQSRLRATKCDLLAKIWGVAKKCISHNFQKRSCPLERTDLSGQALCRKLWKINFFCNTAIFTLFFFKWGSTSATSNSAENNPYHPLPYIFWTVWTWGFTRWYPKHTIPIQKFE